MNNKQRIATGVALAVLAWGGTVSATPVTIADGYHGSNGHGYNDVISSAAQYNLFNIDRAEMSLAGSVLTVDIFTGFAGAGDQKLYSGYTNKTASKINGISQGIGYGDLFLASSWSPYGTAPYNGDDNSNGTVWEYGLSFDVSRWSDGPSTVSLYSLSGTNDQNTLLSQDFMSGATYRNGQEVAVDRASNTVSDTGIDGTFSVVDGSKVTFTVDLAGTSLWNNWNPLPGAINSLALHWAMSCANDVIEGEASFTNPPPPNTSVPEPAALGLTMLGLAGAARRRRRAA
ncbi:MAG: PEP-CTERM sorting domain-containing protein [Gammaproteobacteria bacterium]|nr:PEP-CTERM sorting domain-containing protein [Gammaproteobacteria bacterium]